MKIYEKIVQTEKSEFKIMLNVGVVDEEIWADQPIPIRKAKEDLEIITTLKATGEIIEKTSYKPIKLNLDKLPSKLLEQERYQKLIKGNAYASCGDKVFLVKETYLEIIKAIEDLGKLAEAEKTEEHKALDAEAKAREGQEKKEYDRQTKIENSLGYCKKCGTWCWGDCDAN